MTQNVLWLDDHFDEFGEIGPPAINTGRMLLTAPRPDRLLDMDRRELETMLPDSTIISETRVSGFTQQLIDHIRLARKLPVRAGRAHTFSALVIDIMISGEKKIQYPVVDATGDVWFDADGRVPQSRWATAYTKGDGFDAGFVIADAFLFRERHLLRLPCVFYTHRNIDNTINERLREFVNRGGIAYAFEKLRGAGQVIETLSRVLRSSTE